MNALQEYKPSSETLPKVRTYKDVFSQKSKTLVQLALDFDRGWVVGLLSMWLIELNDSSNVKKKMSDSQIEFTAEQIFNTYSLRITDLVLFFKNIKSGTYGDNYEKLSNEKICGWMDEYYDERCKMAENYTEVINEKVNINTLKVHPKVAEVMFKGIGQENIDHRIDYKNGLGTRFKNRMEKTAEEFEERLKRDVKATPTNEIEKLIDTWSKRNDMKRYVEILIEEIDFRKQNKV